jgi:cell division septation protein DedD
VPAPDAGNGSGFVTAAPPAAVPPRQPARQPVRQPVRQAPRPQPAPPQFIAAADPSARCPGNAVVAERVGPQGSWFELVCDHEVLPNPFDERRKNNASSGPGGVSHVPVPGSRVSNSAVLQHLPKGYRPVWEDGRLNPQRGFGTPQGAAQMALVWSNTVPQVLINAYTGKPVTAIEAQALGLTLPYARPVHPAKRSAAPAAPRATVASRAATPSPAQEALRPRAAAPQPEQRPVAAPADGGRYVQVATFADEGAARRTVTQVQRMGFPARLGHFTRQGQRHQVVMAGPFATEAQALRARDTARGAGYGSAALR